GRPPARVRAPPPLPEKQAAVLDPLGGGAPRHRTRVARGPGIAPQPLIEGEPHEPPRPQEAPREERERASAERRASERLLPPLLALESRPRLFGMDASGRLREVAPEERGGARRASLAGRDPGKSEERLARTALLRALARR